ncbi:MAG: TRIC cation channel family protein, partial [Phenylobacterium sp.]|nr:TRIC cation channel family protein [Phenylobacterium sp.]
MDDTLLRAFPILDYAAVFVFAATGALAAAHRRHDIVTFGFFAAITGVGGGTLRDLLIGA